jgi:hypothetical protein
MRRIVLSLCVLIALTARATELKLHSPVDYQIFQRSTKDFGTITIYGEDVSQGDLEARIIPVGKNEQECPFRKLFSEPTKFGFKATLGAPPGGWYRFEIRLVEKGAVVADASVEHVGIGEVFVVAGQSNSANHGAEKQSTKTGLVASFDGTKWQLANDPQPGASGGGGSFMPPLGDALATRFNVPIGFEPCGIGATSVREWLPKGTTFPNPPTIESRVRQLPSGEWESKGEAYNALVKRIQELGDHNFRAVLWHQGESDANQKDPTRTLPGKLYREYLEKLIYDSNRAIGWSAPWFVAQVSYHVPGDEASPDIREAQASLWKDKLALEGPDSDALKSEWRENGGKGVHFSGPGLREHAARWAEKIGPWLEQQLK